MFTKYYLLNLVHNQTIKRMPFIYHILHMNFSMKNENKFCITLQIVITSSNHFIETPCIHSTWLYLFIIPILHTQYALQTVWLLLYITKFRCWCSCFGGDSDDSFGTPTTTSEFNGKNVDLIELKSHFDVVELMFVRRAQCVFMSTHNCAVRVFLFIPFCWLFAVRFLHFCVFLLIRSYSCFPKANFIPILYRSLYFI